MEDFWACLSFLNNVLDIYILALFYSTRGVNTTAQFSEALRPDINFNWYSELDQFSAKLCNNKVQY
jgi:hypothetical protein